MSVPDRQAIPSPSLRLGLRVWAGKAFHEERVPTGRTEVILVGLGVFVGIVSDHHADQLLGNSSASIITIARAEVCELRGGVPLRFRLALRGRRATRVSAQQRSLSSGDRQIGAHAIACVPRLAPGGPTRQTLTRQVTLPAFLGFGVGLGGGCQPRRPLGGPRLGCGCDSRTGTHAARARPSVAFRRQPRR
jgi:hypothetical protein